MASPMMQQFEAAKARCPGALVLFRMGDFYELFGDDARRAADLLDLTLTSRDKGPDALPMAGFPHHQLDPQLARLVTAGERVAICEQIDDPKTTKGLLRREVTRIVTPGIAADESLLDPARPNHLVAVVPRAVMSRGGHQCGRGTSGIAVGLAWIDVAAGRFTAAVIDRDDLADQLLRLDASELLCSETDRDLLATVLAEAGLQTAVTVRPAWWFDDATAETKLHTALGNVRLTGLGFNLPDERLAITAGGGIVADSDPADEDLECRNKAAGLLAAVPAARRMTARRRAGGTEA